MNEYGFWAKVRKAFNETPGALIKKLPADGFGGDGTADSAYIADGVQGFLELKYAEWPKRESTPVPVGDHGLSPSQRNWLDDWVRRRGRAHVLLGVGSDWFVLETTEVPDDSRVTRAFLDGIRTVGRAGTFKSLKDLPSLMAGLPRPRLD